MAKITPILEQVERKALLSWQSRMNALEGAVASLLPAVDLQGSWAAQARRYLAQQQSTRPLALQALRDGASGGWCDAGICRAYLRVLTRLVVALTAAL